MIELRVLGPIAVKHADGSDVAPMLAQPKRLALATYLASPPPHGGRCFHRKDTLVAMFWPDLDQQRARASLRNALYFLRENIGADALVAHGDEEVGLDPERVWCDLDAFDGAVRLRDHAAALELYRGDVLEGVYVSNAQPFDEWLDAQRLRRRAEVQEAASKTARIHAAAGRFQEALALAQRAQLLAPLNEDAVRAVIALHYLLGDRGGALEEHHRFELLLTEAYDAKPSMETQTLVTAVRAAEPEAEVLAKLMVERPWLRVSDGPQETGRALFDRQVLVAFVQKRLGLARRRGEQVGLVFVRLAHPSAGAAPAERELDRSLRKLAQLIVDEVRDADLVAIVAPGTLVVLPTEDAVLDVEALVARLQRQLGKADLARRSGFQGVKPEVAAAWLNPQTSRSASDLLADAVH